ncbi:MAG: hypothetical protein O3C67_08130 [Cyanobacteria bacterium]|nr:hypothetical protein [Cyanobacteriota bacterium]
MGNIFSFPGQYWQNQQNSGLQGILPSIVATGEIFKVLPVGTGIPACMAIAPLLPRLDVHKGPRDNR